jgi:RNA polymerase sigma-70 factor, ECF subfamily
LDDEGNQNMLIEQIYDQNSKAVYKFFYFKSLSQQIAEDLTSQTFLIMVGKMHNREVVIKDHKKFLYGIMRNVWLRYLQQKYRENIQLIEDMEDFEAYVDSELMREVQTSDEERVRKFIEKLPSSQQQVMRLRLIEHQTLSEICSSLGKDMNYVKTTQKRGIQNLKRLLDHPLQGQGGEL